MKKRRIVFALALTLMLTLALTLFAACNKDKKNTARLVLDAGEGGSIAESEFDVEVGSSVKDFVADKAPTPQGDLLFAGWFEGDAPLADDRTMPREGLTLTAKYTGAITLSVYYLSADGSEYLEPQVTQYDLILGASVTAQAPEGGTVADGFRFAGWARGENEKATIKVGDSFSFETNFGIYEKWDKAYKDFFGGADKLFVPTMEENVVYLERANVGVKKGVFNALSGIFTFDDEKVTVLGGKVLADCFYYFHALEGMVVPDALKTGKTLSFGSGDQVTLTDGGTQRKGSYTLDTFTGEYELKFDSGESMLFSLGNDANGVFSYFTASGEERGVYVYERNGKQDLTNLLFLDGMWDADGFAGLRAFSFDGEFHYAYQGFYTTYVDPVTEEEVPGSYTLYVGQTPVGFFRIGEYNGGKIGGRDVAGVFTISDGYSGEYSLDLSNLYDIQNTLFLDGFGGGEIMLNQNGEVDENGTRTAGTYEIASKSFTVFSLSSGRYTWNDEWIVFTVTGGKQYLLRANTVYGMGYYYFISQAPEFKAWKNSADRNYGTRFGLLPENAAFYPMSDDAYYVMVYYRDVNTNETVYEPIDQGEVEFDDQRNLYKFTSYSLSTDDAEWAFYYTIDPATEYVETTVYTDEIKFDIEGTDEDPTLDIYGTLKYYPESGFARTAKYGTYTIETAYDLFSTSSKDVDSFILRNFYINSGDKDNPKYNHIMSLYGVPTGGVDANDEPIYTYRTVDEPVNLIWKAFVGQSSDFMTLLFIDDTHVAVGGFLDDEDNLLYTFRGTLSQVETSDIYHFEYEIVDDELLANFFGEYVGEWELFKNGCYFKKGTFDGKTAYYYQEGENRTYSNGNDSLTLDGYGRATRVVGGRTTSGEYEFVADKQNGDKFYLFTANGKKEWFTLKQNNTFDFGGDGKQGMYYYFFSEQATFSYLNYIVLFGDGTMFEPGGDDGLFGTYDALGPFDYSTEGGNQWEQFKITHTDGAEVEEYYILSTYLDDIDVNIFIERSPQILDIPTSTGGMIHGDGYNFSTWTEVGETYYGIYGVVDIYDKSPKESEYSSTTNFESGKQVVFIASYLVKDGKQIETDEYFLFDFDEERKVVTLRDKISGTYAFYEKGAIASGTMYLDGHGNAIIYDAAGVKTDEGEYQVGETTHYYKSKNGKGNFSFRTAGYSFAGDNTLIYFNADEEHLYINDDWSVLELKTFAEGSFYNGVYIDHYGVRKDGNYTFMTDTKVSFECSDGSMLYFDLVDKGFNVNRDVFIIEDSVLYAFQGGSEVENLVIPTSVTKIARGVFADMDRIGGTINFNNVEYIDDYAFYNCLDFAVHVLNSDKVTYIGAYAFYAFGTAEGGLSWIYQINMPNVIYIGDYAFHACNQLNLDPDGNPNGANIKLDKIEYIGERAFSINRFPVEREVLRIDLADADLTKIKIHPDAFKFMETSGNTQLGLPVRLLVWGKESQAVVAGLDWSDEIKKCVEYLGYAETNSLENTTFMNFSNGVVFKVEGQAAGQDAGFNVLSVYTFNMSFFTKEEYVASASGYGIIVYKKTDAGLKLVERIIMSDNNTFTFAGNEFHRSAEFITLTFDYLNENYEELSFFFTVEVSGEGDAYTVTTTVSSVLYTKYEYEHITNEDDEPDIIEHKSEYEVNENITLVGNSTFEFEDENGEIHRVEIDYATLTLEEHVQGMRLTSSDGAYTATFSGFAGNEEGTNITQAYHITSLVKVDGNVTIFSENHDSYDRNLFEIAVANDGEVNVYNITFKPGNVDELTFTVSVTRYFEVKLTDGDFEAVFYAEEETAKPSDRLVSFKDGETMVYPGLVEQYTTSATELVLKYSQGKEDFEYVLTLTEGTLSVTKVHNKIIELTSPDNNEHIHYSVNVIVGEDGTVKGLVPESDLKKYAYDNYSGTYYVDMNFMVPKDVRTATTQSGSNTVYTFSFSSGGTTFSVKVTASPNSEGGYDYSLAVN